MITDSLFLDCAPFDLTFIWKLLAVMVFVFCISDMCSLCLLFVPVSFLGICPFPYLGVPLGVDAGVLTGVLIYILGTRFSLGNVTTLLLLAHAPGLATISWTCKPDITPVKGFLLLPYENCRDLYFPCLACCCVSVLLVVLSLCLLDPTASDLGPGHHYARNPST